jgi:hypothetical protein
MDETILLPPFQKKKEKDYATFHMALCGNGHTFSNRFMHGAISSKNCAFIARKLAQARASLSLFYLPA